MTKRLYHYTSEFHLPVIEDDGVLRLTESNVSLTTAHPREVVWFLDRPLAVGEEDLHGLAGSMVDKSEIEITVDIPERAGIRVLPWIPWALAHPDCEGFWISAMVETGGGEALAGTWWVSLDPVPAEYWTVIRRRSSMPSA